MKKLCNCNSSWHDTPHRWSDKIVIARPREVTGIIACTHCGMNPWYDADYENMMFDLRSMNTIW